MPSPARRRELITFKVITGFGKSLHISLSDKHPAIYVSYSFNASPDVLRQLTTMSDYVKRWVGFKDQFSIMDNIEEANSVLVNLRQSSYIYVGREVYVFKTEEEIEHYVSPEGGARIPFAIAFTETRLFFLHEHKSVPIEDVQLTERINGVEKNMEELMNSDALHLYRAFYKYTRNGKWNAVNIQIESRML